MIVLAGIGLLVLVTFAGYGAFRVGTHVSVKPTVDRYKAVVVTDEDGNTYTKLIDLKNENEGN